MPETNRHAGRDEMGHPYEIDAMPSLTDEITGIMQTYEEPLLRYATGILRNPDTARDIVQEAFIKYLRHRQTRDTSIDNVSAWLYRVTHNLALDHIRKHKRVSELGEDHERLLSSDEADPAQIADRREATGVAWQCLDILSDRERQIVLLKVMEERSYKEIAEVMGLSTTNVGFILHTAMKKLAKALKQNLA